MKIHDKRIGNWKVALDSRECPHLRYPRNDITCAVLESHPNSWQEDFNAYCYRENCPLLATLKHGEK